MHTYSGILNMCAAPSTPDHDRLFAFAESQDGYFTIAQALEAGFARSTLGLAGSHQEMPVEPVLP